MASIDTASVSFASIEKLVGAGNYSQWASKMQELLQVKGLWQNITEEDKISHYGTDAPKKEEFQKRQVQTMGLIYSNITPTISSRMKAETRQVTVTVPATPGGSAASTTQTTVTKYDTPKLLWDELKTKYKKQRAIQAFREF